MTTPRYYALSYTSSRSGGPSDVLAFRSRAARERYIAALHSGCDPWECPRYESRRVAVDADRAGREIVGLMAECSEDAGPWSRRAAREALAQVATDPAR